MPIPVHFTFGRAATLLNHRTIPIEFTALLEILVVTVSRRLFLRYCHEFSAIAL